MITTLQSSIVYDADYVYNLISTMEAMMNIKQYEKLFI